MRCRAATQSAVMLKLTYFVGEMKKQNGEKQNPIEQRSSSSLKTLVFSFSSALFKLFHPSPEEQRCDEDDDLTCDFESGGRLKIKEDNI